MKKLLLMTLVLFPAVLCGEELKFITVLSSPVGTFNRVEEVDTQTPVTSPVINFCTSLGSGSIRLNGNANPTAAGMTLSNGTTLGGNVSEYRLQSLTMNDRGTLNGSRLLANTVNANTMPTLVRSSNIYANTLTVQGAKTGGLNVGDGKSVMSGLGPDGLAMVWSNEYQKDKSDRTNADYAKQFLLKSTESGTDTQTCSNLSYKLAHKSECCPSARMGDSICYTQKFVWRESLWHIGPYKYIVVQAAGSCWDDGYSGSGGEVVVPTNFGPGWQFLGNAPSCYKQGISAGEECDPTVVKSSTCYIGLSNWPKELRKYYADRNRPFYPDLVVDTTNAPYVNVGCVWSNIEYWPQLLCEASGEYIRNGW